MSKHNVKAKLIEEKQRKIDEEKEKKHVGKYWKKAAEAIKIKNLADKFAK